MFEQKIDLVLEFPEGDFVITSRECHVGNGIYFMQPDSDKAYLGWGSQKELMGKIHRNLPSRSEQFDTYDVTYEIEDEKLISARLITPFAKSAGKLASNDKVQHLNDKLQNGSLELKGKHTPPEIKCAATLPNGDTLLVVRGLSENEYTESLFIGEIGNLQEFTMENGVQGGNRSMCTVKETGERLEYDYQGNAFGNHGVPFYGDHVLRYIDLDDYTDLAQFGIDTDTSSPHLDPFCPELTQP